MIAWRLLARATYVIGGAIAWSAPGLAAGWLYEPAWPYVFFPLLAYGCWRGATVRVREVRGGLVVRNVLRTFDLAWANVTKVGWSDVQDGTWEAPSGYVLPLVHVDGRRRVAVLALACWMRPSRRDAATVRGWAERVRTSRRRSSPPRR